MWERRITFQNQSLFYFIFFSLFIINYFNKHPQIYQRNGWFLKKKGCFDLSALLLNMLLQRRFSRKMVWFVSSESFHWTHWIVDTCPLLDMCPNPDVSSENFHWTQVVFGRKNQKAVVHFEIPVMNQFLTGCDCW